MGIADHEPLYLYALDKQECLIHVSRAKSGHIYACPGCKTRLVLHRGTERVEHFKHHDKDSCGGETYLHNVAKRLFFTNYQRALKEHRSFTLKLSREAHCANYADIFTSTCQSSEMVDFNLTRFFDHIQLEVKYDDFKPDVLLSSTKSNEVLFVEIAVTHPCEQEKIDSGFRIIEFSIHDEDDLDVLNCNAIIPENPQIRIYNINAAPKELTACSANCMAAEDVLCVDTGGIVRRLNGARRIVGRALRNGNIVAHQVLKSNENLTEVLRTLLSQAVAKGVLCHNCYLCPHASFSAEFPRVYCLKKSRDIRYSEADRCLHYEINP